MGSVSEEVRATYLQAAVGDDSRHPKFPFS
jgi:hypothetical protein